MRKLLIFCLLSITCHLYAQKARPVLFDIMKNSSELPDKLTSGRIAVLLSTPEKRNWKQTGEELHNQLKRMNLDVVMYIHFIDYTASPELQTIYASLMEQRKIENVLLVRVDPNGVTMLAGNFKKANTVFDLENSVFAVEGNDIASVTYQLAIKVKQLGTKTVNFLVPESPEYFEDVPLIEKTEFPSYPSQLKRLPMAVVPFYPLPYDSLSQDNDKQNRVIQQYNQQVYYQNRKLKSILDQYPFEYQFVEETQDKELYKAGFQFVLRNLHTSGQAIKELLNIASETIETDYISIIPIGTEQRTLKTIPTFTTVYKFYFKQTISGDAYMGRHWDAAENWEEALHSFLTHMKRDFDK